MKKHDNSGGTITFRAYVGNGEYRGLAFDLNIASMPDGTLLGLPVIDFKDDARTSVTLELEDVVPTAYRFAFGSSTADTHYDRLFGTPERAARAIVALNNCRVTDCADCRARGACRYYGEGGDYESLIEWLEEEA